jgi:circadian clock protein KaiB
MSKRIMDKKKTKRKPESEEGQKYILQLFVTGILPHSTRAVANIEAICEKYLQGRYELEIIDIYQQPSLAFAEDIIAIPLLVKKFPLPAERIIGDLSDTQWVLEGLHLV